MRKSRTIILSSCAAVSLIGAGTLFAQDTSEDFRSLIEEYEIPVTVDNFVRAATDLELRKYVTLSGGVNTVFHLRELTPIDQQTTIRMNRDTLYSVAIIDIRDGASITLPDTGDRYISAHIINQDHYMDVFSGGGTHTIDQETFLTPYVALIVRTLVDAEDLDDVAKVHAFQDQIVVDAGSAIPFITPNYDEDTFEDVLKAALGLASFVPDSSATFGMPDEVDPVRHLLGTAFGWGGLPEDEAFYLNIEPGLPVGEYRIEVPADVPVGAFWSVSLYNARGFFEPNALNAYSINSVTGTRNEDQSVTVHLGGCNDGRVNCLPIMDGWNYAVRLYQPGAEIINGDWTFPAAQAVE